MDRNKKPSDKETIFYLMNAWVLSRFLQCSSWISSSWQQFIQTLLPDCTCSSTRRQQSS